MSTNTNSSLTSKDWLERSQYKLKQAGIATARLDCLVLLEDATEKDKAFLLAHPELLLKNSVVKRLEEQIERRCKHEPLAYIRGKSEFYGREFTVTPDTLEPRPESEAMIELLTQIIKTNAFNPDDKIIVADIGTGSGCIAITAKLEIPRAEVLATDISPACLRVAKTNAKKLGADVCFYEGDLLKPLLASSHASDISVIMANLPYVPDTHAINQAAMHEPRQAIFGGPNGLDLYRRMFTQIKKQNKWPEYILAESFDFQHRELALIAKKAGFEEIEALNFIQIFRHS